MSLGPNRSGLFYFLLQSYSKCMYMYILTLPVVIRFEIKFPLWNTQYSPQ